jgi:hypothetical protein
MWSIEPQGVAAKGLSVANRELTYGKIPDGYVQTFPGHGPTNALSPGLVYAFEAETTGASGVDGFLYMDGNTPIVISVPGLCESAFTGDVKPVRCGTGETFVEPTDLEAFVRDHRLTK